MKEAGLCLAGTSLPGTSPGRSLPNPPPARGVGGGRHGGGAATVRGERTGVSRAHRRRYRVIRADRSEHRRKLRADVHRQRLPGRSGATGREGYAGGSVPAESTLARFYAQAPGQVQQRANLPIWSTLTFSDGGQDFSLGTGQLSDWQQQLDLHTGVISTTAT